MKAENYFLRYALPCAHVLRDLKEITDKELEELEGIAVNDKEISIERLEKLFFRAFEKMKKHSEKFDIPSIKKYFQEIHNKEIDNREGYYSKVSEMERELSKVRIGEVISKEGGILTVRFGNEKRNVFSKFISGAKKGDKVWIHFFYAVEKVKT